MSIADSEGRGIEAVRQDRAAYDLPPGDPRPATLTRSVVFGAPDVVLMDLPQLSEDQPAHRPMVAAHAVPWPGEMAVFRSASSDGFALLTTFGSRARIGTLVSDLYPGPTSRFDLGNALVVDLASGTLESVTDLTLFGGANALAVESTLGKWEIVQAGGAELIAPGRYRLTRLLRGQRGTEAAMGNPSPAGARVAVLDSALASLPIAEADLGLPWNWRIGPAARAVSDVSYTALAFTPAGRGLVPFAPVHIGQPWRTARSPGDLTIRWTRRSRALVADAWEQVEVPLAEDFESYDVQILDGGVGQTDADEQPRRPSSTPPPSKPPIGAHRSAPVRHWRSASTSSRTASVAAIPLPSHSSSEGPPMSDISTHLGLPYLLAAQAQKHVTHNEALRLLDAMVQLSVLDRTRTTPPVSPTDGDRHLVASGATGLWAGWDLNVAFWVDGVWLRLVPRQGWLVWIAAEQVFVVWNGSAWDPVGVPVRTSRTPSSALSTTPTRQRRRCFRCRGSRPARPGPSHCPTPPANWQSWRALRPSPATRPSPAR